MPQFFQAELPTDKEVPATFTPKLSYDWHWETLITL